MKKFFALFAIFALTTVASANLTVSITDATPPKTSDLTPITLSVDGGSFFNTFCLEEFQGLTVGNHYGIIENDISTSGSNPTTLDNVTKMLYSAYLNGYSFNLGNLQRTIWAIESSPITVPTPGTYTYSYATVSYSSTGVVTATAIDLGGWVAYADGYESVQVLNIYDLNSANEKIDLQSVLIRVPAPGAVLLSGLGTVLVGFARRRSL